MPSWCSAAWASAPRCNSRCRVVGPTAAQQEGTATRPLHGCVLPGRRCVNTPRHQRAFSMLAESFAQIRFAVSLIFGVPFDTGSLERLVDALRQTRHEFGRIEPAAGELLRGPALDDETRREVQLRRFRGQAIRGARETTYYGRLFGRLGMDPARLRFSDIAHIPPTPKEAVREDPDAFVRRNTRPSLRAVT